MLVYIVGDQKLNYLKWMDNAKPTSNMNEADLVLFTGGEDICPLLYKETPHEKTIYNVERDFMEMEYYEKAQQLGKPMLGICRGAQLLAVLSGDSLRQHVENHNNGEHEILLINGAEVNIASTHHQMIAGRTGKIMAVSTDRAKLGQPNIEMMLYQSNILCVQGHPEMMSMSELHTYLNIYIKNLINGNRSFFERMKVPSHISSPINNGWPIFINNEYNDSEKIESSYKFWKPLLGPNIEMKENQIFVMGNAIPEDDDYFLDRLNDYLYRWESEKGNPFRRPTDFNFGFPKGAGLRDVPTPRFGRIVSS